MFLSWYWCPYNALRVYKKLVTFRAFLKPSLGQLLCPANHFIHTSSVTAPCRGCTANTQLSYGWYRTHPQTTAPIPAHTTVPLVHTTSISLHSVVFHFSPLQSTRCPLFCEPCGHWLRLGTACRNLYPYNFVMHAAAPSTVRPHSLQSLSCPPQPMTLAANAE